MFKRVKKNPILLPDKTNIWEAEAAFNPSVVKENGTIHMLYRAMSSPKEINGACLSVSSIAHAISKDGIEFQKIGQLIQPENNWERFGCEDPRITKLNDKFYIFYTALSSYPFHAGCIKVGLAITKDFKNIELKKLATRFNSKAMALFPEKIDGKFVAILTANTDLPPSKIALAFFEKEEDIWSETYWKNWAASLNFHVIPLLRNNLDHIEVGSPPIRTETGWLIFYSYIQNYFSGNKIFGVEAVLLDLNNPFKVIGRSKKPLLIPEKQYELEGLVPNIIFPSGSLIQNEKVYLYYGGADTNCCVAEANVTDLLADLVSVKKNTFLSSSFPNQFCRLNQNPILSPRPEFIWESKAVFNPAAIYENGRVHLVYRALSADDTSCFGYASSKDGINFDERLLEPIYVPHESFEMKLVPGNSGCEDPRITKMGDRFYMFYTAYDGYNPSVAFTSISVNDFLNKNWNWDCAKIISNPDIHNKNSCLLSKKINGKFVIFHRFGNDICIDFIDNLDFSSERWLKNEHVLIKAESDEYHIIEKVGIAAPPLETEHGWILFYHAVHVIDDVKKYFLRIALLDLKNPLNVLQKGTCVFQPEMDYEKYGIVNNVIFPCGAVVLKREIFLYYGGADRVVCLAKMALDTAFEILKVK